MNRYNIWTRAASLLLVMILVLSPLCSIPVRATETGEDPTTATQPTEAQSTEPNPTEAPETKPTEPETTEPQPTEPEPTQPEETEPEETEPETTEPEHEHDFYYETNESGNKLTAYCDEDDCPVEKITLKLVATGKVYDGTAVTVKLERLEEFKKATGAEVTLSVTRDGSPASDLALCGNYLAQALVKVGGERFTLKQNFEITKRNLSFSGINAKGKEYDGTTDVKLDFSKLKFEGKVAADTLNIEVKRAVLPTADAGVHTVALEGVQLTGDKADNYTLDLAKSQSKCEFVEVTRKDISAAQVTLGPTLFCNGKSQTQIVESVKLVEDGVEFPGEITYIVRNNTVQDEGFYTLTISGSGNFTGTLTRDFVVLPSSDQITGTSMHYGLGSLSIEVQENDLGIQLVSGLETAVQQLPVDRLIQVANGDRLVWTIIPRAIKLDPSLEMGMKTAAGERTPLGSGISFTLYETVNGVTDAVDNVLFTPTVSLKLTEDLGKKDVGFLRMIRGASNGSGGWHDIEQVEMTYNSKDTSFSFPAKMNTVYALWGKEPSKGISGLTIAMILILVLSSVSLIAAGCLLYKLRREDEEEDGSEFNVFTYLKNVLGKGDKEEEYLQEPVQSKQPLQPKAPAPVQEPEEPAVPEEPQEFEEEFSLEQIMSEVKAYDAPEEQQERPRRQMSPIVINRDEKNMDLYELERILNENPDADPK